MIDFCAFSDELVKIALEGFKPLGAGIVGVEIKAQLPVLSRMPKDPEKARLRIEQALAGEEVPTILGYKNIVIPESRMPDLASMGFRPTRIATPLPGERPLTVSYRAGTLHAHKVGPAFLIHQDDTAPMGEKGGYLSLKAMKHGLREGIPSIIKRVRERDRFVIGV